MSLCCWAKAPLAAAVLACAMPLVVAARDMTRFLA